MGAASTRNERAFPLELEWMNKHPENAIDLNFGFASLNLCKAELIFTPNLKAASFFRVLVTMMIVMLSAFPGKRLYHFDIFIFILVINSVRSETRISDLRNM